MKQKLLITMIGLGLLLSACSTAGKAMTATPEAISTVIKDSSILAEGRVEPWRDAEIAFNASGVVSEVWEWLKWWGKEVHYMCGIIWIVLFVKLSAVETINKKAQSAFERKWATRKAT